MIGFEHSENQYFYDRDLLGVIRNIIDINGNIVVKYKYDAWGNHKVYDSTNAENTNATFIGNINPFRYKGYYYDVETKWYYLQSRYYDPVLSRFISMDHTTYLEPGSTVGVNLFAYCVNNPVMYSDVSGYLPQWLKNTLAIGGVVLIVAGIAVAAGFTGGLAGAALMAVAFSTGIGAYSGVSTAIEDGTSIAAGVLSGGLKGLAIGTAIGLGIMTGGGAFSTLGGLATFGGSLAINFGVGIGSNAIDSKMNNKDFSWNNAFNNGFKQMASGAFAFAAGGLIGASGFYNIPGQTKMFSSQWFGNTASGLLFKAVYYYGIDAVIWMM